MSEPFTPPTQLLLGDLEAVIRDYARADWRSQQVELGPSEVGQSCQRRLALTILGAKPINDDRDEWTSSVGTAIHTWMAKALIAANERLVAAGQPPRWLVEQETEVRTGMVGHTDAYDLWTHTVVDHKFPGVTSIRKYRKKGNPGQQYRWQAHLYGRSWAKLGFPVKNVAIALYPRSGLVRDSWLWQEAYSPAIADEALAHIDSLMTAMDIAESMGELPTLISSLERDCEHCGWCPFFNGGPNVPDDPTLACGGPFEDPGYAEQSAAKARSIPGIL
jgi:hypothetical protein